MTSADGTVGDFIANIPQTSMLYTLPVIEEIFDTASADNITREKESQVYDVVEIDTRNIPEYYNPKDGKESITIPHCHVMSTLAFTSYPDETIYSSSVERASAIALGIQHLNAGNSSIVEGWKELRESMCSDLVFTLEYFDSRNNPGSAVDRIFNVTERRIPAYLYKTPCSFIGSSRSEITLSTALITGYKGFMEVSGSSTAFQLDQVRQYPNFARTIPNDQNNVIPILTYFADELDLNYLALVHVNEAYGNSFADSLIRRSQMSHPHLTIRRFAIDSLGDTVSSTLARMKDSQFRYMLAVMPTMRMYHELMTEAFHLEMTGREDYQWYFSDSFALDGGNLTENQALRIAYNGTGRFRPSAGRLRNNTSYGEFVLQLQNLSESTDDRNIVMSMIPEYDNETEFQQDFTEDEETTYFGHDSAAFSYDATMAMGMSACHALATTRGFSSSQHFEALVNRIRFRGATGDVEFNDAGSRTYNSTFYDLTNYVIEEVSDVKVDVRFTTSNTYYNGTWIPGEAGFIFGNGDTLPPEQLTRPSDDNNAIPPYMKGLALSLSALAMSLAIGLGIWTWYNKSARVIQASQPFFLYLVCFGMFLVAGSIVPYSIDDTRFDIETCSRACTAILWLLFPGLAITFSALFTKTHRINLIMKHSRQFRRVKVTIRQTLTTMGVMLLLTIVTLSLMTALNPPRYVRQVRNIDDFNRPSESYGMCDFKDQLPYVITLVVIDMLIASLSAYQSWEARKLSTEFAESKYIFAALLVSLCLSFVALPVIVMTKQIPKISVFTYSAAIFFLCSAILLLIFIPKIRFLYSNKSKKKEPVVGGLNPSNPDSVTQRRQSSLSADAGEKILTTQSAKELFRQVLELQRLLDEKEEEQKNCKCIGSSETNREGK